MRPPLRAQLAPIFSRFRTRTSSSHPCSNFKHEKIPIIKHWNPSVEFKVKMTETDPPQVTVLTGTAPCQPTSDSDRSCAEGNATETFAVEALRADAILELVVKHDRTLH